nr:hypothetical protein [Tanacetum cinerariifolium]
MEEYCLDNEIQKLEIEFWNHKMVGSNINGYTARFHELARLVPQMVTLENHRYGKPFDTNGIKDGIFKKQENVGNKKRSNDHSKNRGRDNRNKRQRTGRNFTLTAQRQGQGQRQYAVQRSKYAKCNFHHSGNCLVYGRCN